MGTQFWVRSVAQCPKLGGAKGHACVPGPPQRPHPRAARDALPPTPPLAQTRPQVDPGSTYCFTMLEAGGTGAERVVSEDKGDHRFGHRHEAWEQAGVVAPFGLHFRSFALAVDGGLGLGQ